MKSEREREKMDCIFKHLTLLFALKAFTGFIGEVPKAADHWKDDRFFGYQFLNGCNPDSIKRCTQLPTNFPVTQQLIGNLLDTGDTLEKAMNVRYIKFMYC